jgi:hypothetical protein
MGTRGNIRGQSDTFQEALSQIFHHTAYEFDHTKFQTHNLTKCVQPEPKTTAINLYPNLIITYFKPT